MDSSSSSSDQVDTEDTGIGTATGSLDSSVGSFPHLPDPEVDSSARGTTTPVTRRGARQQREQQVGGEHVFHQRVTNVSIVFTVREGSRWVEKQNACRILIFRLQKIAQLHINFVTIITYIIVSAEVIHIHMYITESVGAGLSALAIFLY